MNKEKQHPLQNKKILFLTGAAGRDELMYELSKELKKEYNIDNYFIAEFKRNTAYLSSKGIDKKKIFEILPFYKGSIKKPDISYLQECEKKYGMLIWDAWEISRERKKKRSKISSDNVLSYFEYTFKEIENVLDKIKPDYVIQLGAAAYHTKIMYAVSMKKSKVMEFKPARIFGRFTIVNNLKDKWPVLTMEYKKLQKRNLTPSELKQAADFINNYRNNPLRAEDGLEGKKKISNRFKIIKYWFHGLIADKRIPGDFSILKRKVKEKYFCMRHLFEMPENKEKFILFNLHLQPEISTSLYGKYFTNQLNLIQILSKSIPVGYKLYVKEHYTFFGNRTLNFFNKIRDLPNVRLISPFANTFDLIKKSSLIITITGTVGWEGLLFQKPVITLGDVYFNIFKDIKKVNKIEELPKIIETQLDKKIKKEEIIKFLTALFNTTYQGLVLCPHECNNKSIKKENIKNIVWGLKKYIEYDG